MILIHFELDTVQMIVSAVILDVRFLRQGYQKLKLKLKTNLYSAVKSEDSEVPDSGTSQLGSQRGFDEREMF